jgi:hypothetical protein
MRHLGRAIGGLILLLAGCNWAGEKTGKVLNKGGELVGSAATEVIEGVTTGVERSWRVDVRLSRTLEANGLTLGKTIVEANSAGRNNRLVVYLSSTTQFQDTVTAVALDQDGLEMGRARVAIALPPGSGDHYTVQFQEYTDLERKSRVEISR